MKYYSDVTKKLYNTEEDLQAAEKLVAEENAKKELASEQKREEANKVEEAFKARNAARREYNTKIIEAKKTLNSAITAAKEAYAKVVNDANTTKDQAEEAYDAALKEFTKKHPEGYHMTLKDGDNVMTISSSSDKQFDSIHKDYDDFLASLLNFWKR